MILHHVLALSSPRRLAADTTETGGHYLNVDKPYSFRMSAYENSTRSPANKNTETMKERFNWQTIITSEISHYSSYKLGTLLFCLPK